MDRHPQNDWNSVRYDVRFDLYWIEAGGAKQQLFYCPWCGEALPPSHRDRWFDALDALGIDPGVDPVPEPFKTGAWRGAPEPIRPPRERGAIEGRYIDFFDLDEADESDDG
jgi:ribosomal protein S27AE